MIHVAVVSPMQAVRLGLRAMLSEASSSERLDDASVSLEVLDSAGMAELENWLDILDILILTADSFHPDDLQRLSSRHKGRLAVLLLAEDPQLAIDLVGLPLRAWGVLPMDCSIQELIAAVQAIHEGLLVGSPVLIKPGLTQLLANRRIRPELITPEIVEPLTPREIEVLQLLALGLSNKQIAARLNISEHTVKFHSSSIYTKLGVVSRTEAVRVGVQMGIISL